MHLFLACLLLLFIGFGDRLEQGSPFSMTSIKKTALASLFALVSFGVAQPTQAAPVLDQSSAALMNDQFCSCEFQQGITAGMTGVLAGITLYGYGTAEVRIAAGAAPHTGSWAIDTTFSLNGSGSYLNLTPYDFTVTSAGSFVIDVTAYALLGTTTKYVGGDLYWINSSPIDIDPPGYGETMGFQTYVSAAQPAPEPASMALLGAGIAGLGMIRRRKVS
jgi:hypothetical protein